MPIGQKPDTTTLAFVNQKTAIILIGVGLFYWLIGQGIVDLYVEEYIQWDGLVAVIVIGTGVVGLVRRGKDNYNERRDP